MFTKQLLDPLSDAFVTLGGLTVEGSTEGRSGDSLIWGLVQGALAGHVALAGGGPADRLIAGDGGSPEAVTSPIRLWASRAIWGWRAQPGSRATG